MPNCKQRFWFLFSEALPEAIKNECAGCSDKQKEGAKKVMKFLHNNKPAVYEEMLNKFDPDGSYREKYKKESEEFFKN